MNEQSSSSCSSSCSSSSSEDGPELRSIRMNPTGSRQPSIGFSSSVPLAKEEPMMQQALHAQEWNVPSVLPTIPSGYNLGPSHVVVDDASPQTIAGRIAKELAQYSVAAMPHKSHENSLHAETSCGLKFAVNLFAVGNGNGNPSVVVEVERRIGCSYGFHISSNIILRAAKGIPNCTFGPPSLEIPKCVPQDAKEERKKCVQFDTHQALKLVRSERKDAQLLGLQSLERLSADEYAASLLQNDEAIGSLQSFLQSSFPTCVMKRRALGVLANIMKFCPKHEENNNRCDKLGCQVFLDNLFGMLRKCANSPHEACAATKCLQRSLDDLSDEKHEDLAEILGNFQAGHHSQLEYESKVLRDRLLQQQ